MQTVSRKLRAFTLIEMLVVSAILAILAAVLLPALARGKMQARAITCANNLNQMGKAFKTWSLDHQDHYPMSVSPGNGGPPVALYWLTPRSFNPLFEYMAFVVMSNELSTPKLLACPADDGHSPQTNWAFSVSNPSPRPTPEISNWNLSYLLGIDANDTRPQMILAGDRNIYGNQATQTMPVVLPNPYGNASRSWAGTVEDLGTNLSPRASAPAWTAKLHQQRGNLLLVDGSVRQVSSSQLRQQLSVTGDPHHDGPNHAGNIVFQPNSASQ